MLITVLDTETTGLDPKQHEIIQFAAVRVYLKDDGSINITDKIDIKIKPKDILLASPHALKINGYTEAAWIGALEIDKHLSTIENFISTSDFLLGQNLIFDMRFLAKAFANANKKINFGRYADTRQMANKLVAKGILKNASMDRLCEHYDIKFHGRAHTALTDCQRTINVWLKLLEETEMDFFTFEEPYDKNRK
jgi:DNA polymerase III epsilon subunit-like protein